MVSIDLLRKYKLKSIRFALITFISSLLLVITFAVPSYAHWADLSVAEVMVGNQETKISLTFPTGLLAFADDNQDNQLSAEEVNKHNPEIQNLLGKQIRLSDRQNQTPLLKVLYSNNANQSSSLKALGSKTHITLDLLLLV